MARTPTEEEAKEEARQHADNAPNPPSEPSPASEASETTAEATSDDAPSAKRTRSNESTTDLVADGDPSAEGAPDVPPKSATGSETAGGKRRRVDAVTGVALVLVVVAAAVAGYFGWSWYGAAHDDSLHYSRARDAVLLAAEQGVQNMNTLDYRNVDQGLAAWEDSSTGDLHQELVSGRSQFAAQVREAKTVTTAKILDGAVSELDDRAGKAGVMVALQITVTPPKGEPTTKQSRMRAQLTRTPSGWKLSALGQAPVGTSG